MNKLKQIITISKNLGSTPVIACIGSTKDIADSLGPITGQLLVEKYKTNAVVVGTLLSPLHALNLEESLGKIKTKYPTSKIIAVDACASIEKSEKIVCIKGGIKPGLASGKNLPRIGDYSIVGSTFTNSVQSLGEVYLLADKIAKLINFIVSSSR